MQHFDWLGMSVWRCALVWAALGSLACGAAIEPRNEEPTRPQQQPPTPSAAIAPSALEQLRIAGQKFIVPDDETMAEIDQAGRPKLVTTYKLCIDTAGSVAVLDMLKPSGFPAYDAKMQREMRAWRYRPYTVDGVAKAVCTSIIFIYNWHK